MAGYAFAHGLRAVDAIQHRLYGSLKTKLLRDIEGTVVEIGPGTGLNLAYLNRRLTWIGVEPNPHLHPMIQHQLDTQGIAGTVLESSVEEAPLPDRCADVVISTLVLCSVPSVRTALDAIRRILRPGGRFIFIEHIAAPRDSCACTLQHAVTPLWHRCFDGCHPNRRIDQTISHAGFTSVEQQTTTLHLPVIAPHCHGYAHR